MSLRRAVLAGLVLAATRVRRPRRPPRPSCPRADRLQDRRYAATERTARILGFEDGRFYANGWHITGEMGGVWSSR